MQNNQFIDPRDINLDQEVIDAAMARGRYMRSQALSLHLRQIGHGVSRIYNALAELSPTSKAHGA
ncbi:MAG: hypothetical protein JKY20_01635 [Alphaproteobacteria bacterium]|nr:hypothetical protein [Alphaproteobacteria bacterium]